jgi:hypothetical protein
LSFAYKIINFTLWNWYNNYHIKPSLWLGHEIDGNYNISLALKKFSEKYWTVYAEDFHSTVINPAVEYIGDFYDPEFGCDWSAHPCITVQEAQQKFTTYAKNKDIIGIRGHPYFLNGTNQRATQNLTKWQQFIDWMYQAHTYINMKHPEAIEYKIDRDNFIVEKNTPENYTIDLTRCTFDHNVLFTNPDGTNQRNWTLYDQNGKYIGIVRGDVFLKLKSGVKYYLSTTGNTTTPVIKLYERFDPTYNDEYNIYGARWKSETFTVGNTGPNEKHTITSVKLYLSRNGVPVGFFNVSIRATTSSGAPTGSDLTFGSILCSSVTTAGWYEITFNTPYVLSAGTKYAIIARATKCTSSTNDICWAILTTGGYSGGQKYDSTNSGSSWTVDSVRDFLFREYGISIT